MRSFSLFASFLVFAALVSVLAFVIGVVPAVDRYAEGQVKAAAIAAASAVQVAEINGRTLVQTAEISADRDVSVAAFSAASAGARELGGIARLSLVAASLVILGVLLGIGLLAHQSMRYGASVTVRGRRPHA